MVTVRDVNANKFVAKTKGELKKIEDIKPPVWSKFAKSGVHTQRPPEQEDFWYMRSSSVLRRIYLDGPIGVSKLRTYYGGRKNRGRRPARFRKSGGNIIRKVLQQLENVGFIEKAGTSGRQITSKGRKFLDRIAYEASKE